MSDETATATPEVEAEKKTRAVSKREVLDSALAPQDDWAGAAGVRYTSLAEGFALDVIFDELPSEIRDGLTAFGALTLAGNVTNTVRNGERKGDGPATEKEALIAWLENLKAGNWTSPRGEVEAGIGLLAEAYVRAMAKSGKTVELDAVKEKLAKADKDAKKKVRTHPDVKQAMLEIQLERTKAKAAENAGDVAELL